MNLHTGTRNATTTPTAPASETRLRIVADVGREPMVESYGVDLVRTAFDFAGEAIIAHIDEEAPDNDGAADHLVALRQIRYALGSALRELALEVPLQRHPGSKRPSSSVRPVRASAARKARV